MPTINYQIKLDESGRPYIHLPNDYDHKIEDRFFALEIARYIIQSAYTNKSPEFDPTTSKNMEIGLDMVGQISDNVAEILYKQMEYLGDLMFDMVDKYHIVVGDIQERDSLDMNRIIYEDKIYKRQIGLKVFVSSENKIYELYYDIENWEEV